MAASESLTLSDSAGVKEKEMKCWPMSLPQLHKGSTVYWKLCLNLRFYKWIKSYIPVGLSML